MDNEAAKAEIRRHLMWAERHPDDDRRSWIGMIAAIEKRFGIVIERPDELVRRVAVEEREPVAA